MEMNNMIEREYQESTCFNLISSIQGDYSNPSIKSPERIIDAVYRERRIVVKLRREEI